MGDFRKLVVWQRARELDQVVYGLSSRFPSGERFGLTEQTRKAAASITANIAEGCGRNTDRELARFLRISLGSANELENHLMRSQDPGFVADEAIKPLINELHEIKGMLASFIRSLGSAD